MKRKIPTIIIPKIIILIIMVIAPAIVSAEIAQNLKDDGWDEIQFDDLTPNSFTAGDDTSGLARHIQVSSQSSVSIAFLNVDVDLVATPKLEWSWQSLTPIIDTDTTLKGGDDRTLAIYVAFPYQPENASFSDSLRRASAELLKGADTPDRILTYIWGGGAEQGTKVENPYLGRNGHLIFLRTPLDSEGVWFDERVDVRSDFVEVFGFEPVSPVYIAITSDSDDTQSTVNANVRGLRFVQ